MEIAAFSLLLRCIATEFSFFSQEDRYTDFSKAPANSHQVMAICQLQHFSTFLSKITHIRGWSETLLAFS